MTLKRTLVSFIKIILFFLPLYFGLVILASCIFYQHYPFMSISSSMVSLFSVIFGDTNFVIMLKAFYFTPLSVLVFFFFYFVIFITFFLKLLVSIVEAAFYSTKMRKRLYWVEKEMTLDDYIKFEYKQISKDVYIN